MESHRFSRYPSQVLCIILLLNAAAGGAFAATLRQVVGGSILSAGGFICGFISPFSSTSSDAPSFAAVAAAHASETSKAPQYGLSKGRLLPCKSVSNCISTSSVNSVDKYARPWAFEKDAAAEFEDLVSAVRGYSYLKLADVDAMNLYLRAEAKSAVPPTGVDDVEFLLNAKEKLITYRSNSRELLKAGADLVGDGGSNRNRLEAVRRRLGVQEMGMNDETAAYVEQVTNKMSFFERLKAASQPNEINFIDNSVPED